MAVIAATASITSTGCAPDPPSSVVGLTVDGCTLGLESGSGMVVGDGLVLTAAHVVAGADTITVIRSGRTATAGEIVGFDPDMDLAYVSIPGDSTVTLDVASRHVEADDTGVAYVVRDGKPVTLPVRVIRPVTISTEDIYVEDSTKRPGFELDVEISPGDSGGPVVVDGKVIGVLWARARSDRSRAYAIDADRAGTRIRRQLTSATLQDVDPTRC